MNNELSEVALEFGRIARRALEDAGGDELALVAEREPERRTSLVVPVLAELGAWELDLHDPDQLEAAAALCRSSGYWAAPYPVAERVCRPSDEPVEGLVVVAEANPRAALAGLGGSWATVGLSGERAVATPSRAVDSEWASALVGLELEPADGDGSPELPLALVLPCWTLLGMLDRAMELTRSHVEDRKQFGQRLSSFQGVQFRLTEAEVERMGLEELAKYALWSVQVGRDDALLDALGLRLAAIEAAEVVFRAAHQLHGAIGFCDETTVSWLSRSSLVLRRLPLGSSATRAELARRAGREGLSGLFDDPRIT